MMRSSSSYSFDMAAVLPLLLILLLCPPFASAAFSCTGTTKSCEALLGYTPANDTTYSAIMALFEVPSIRQLFGANNLSATSPHSTPVRAGNTVRVPFPCSCSANGTGVSSGRPIYTVKKGDSLDYISRTIFGGFVKYPEVQAANNIPDPNKIDVGQKLRIPLPCSCDAVDGAPVVHYAHKVKAGSDLAGIAAEFGTTADTLMRLNGIGNASELQAEQILDVPLKVCNSSIRNDSRDSSLLVPSGSYALTADNCVQCSCNNASLPLQCLRTQGFNHSTCPVTDCPLGASSPGSSACESTICSYAGYRNQTIGYRNQTIFTVLANISTCPASGPSSSSPPANRLVGSRGIGWMELLVFCNIVFFCLL